jgi:hypothetical protein
MTSPRFRELRHLGQRTDNARQLVAFGMKRRRQGVHDAAKSRSGNDEVVRRGAEGRPHDRVVLPHGPKTEARKHVRRRRQDAGESEHQIVPGLVLEQERTALFEEPLWIVDGPHVHPRIVERRLRSTLAA